MSNSPWGKIDAVTNYCRGLSFVSTPGHGGFRVTDKLLRKHAIDADSIIAMGAITIGQYHFFEEDCAYALLLSDCPALLKKVAEQRGRAPQQLLDSAMASVRRWFPQYFETRTN